MAGGLKKNRRRVFKTLRKQHGNNCHWCGKPMCFETREQPLSATVEHLLPRSAGGTNAIANLRLAHQRCNNARNKPLHKWRAWLARQAG